MDAAEELRRAKASEDLPPLPPLLAQILAETRAKQAAKAARAERGEPEPAATAQADDGEAKLASGPLFLEAAPSHGLVMAGTNVAPHVDRDSEASESDGEPEKPPGPVDASRCRAHGPAFSGAAACQPVKMTITARDSSGKRIREGGAHILVMVEPTAALGAAEEPEPIQAEVSDHGDGTYTATYSVPTKGNYQVSLSTPGTSAAQQQQVLPTQRWMFTTRHCVACCSHTCAAALTFLLVSWPPQCVGQYWPD